MSRKTENIGFVCAHCGASVMPLTNGSYRNHCPCCLYSIHMDNMPGDRSSGCLGLMKPAGMRYNGKKGWQIVHRCLKCGMVKVNLTAIDTAQPDDQNIIRKLMILGDHHANM